MAQRLRGWTFMIALGLVAVALTLLSDGHLIVGIGVILVSLPAAWLGRVWVSPWGVDRYALRVSDVLQGGSREVNDISRARHASLRTLRVRITEVEPSVGCRDIHQEITDRVREMDCLEARHNEPLADRAIRMNAISRDLMRALERLSACHPDSRASEIVGLVDQLMRDVAATRRATEAPLERMSKRLRKMRVPKGWRDQHNRCEAAVAPTSCR